MDFRSGNLNQVSTQSQASAYTGASCDPNPPISGLFDGLLNFKIRLGQVNNTLDSLLQRAYGPRPTGADCGKSPDVPSIKTMGSLIEQEINLLERMTSELSSFIG